MMWKDNRNRRLQRKAEADIALNMPCRNGSRGEVLKSFKNSLQPLRCYPAKATTTGQCRTPINDLPHDWMEANAPRWDSTEDVAETESRFNRKCHRNRAEIQPKMSPNPSEDSTKNVNEKMLTKPRQELWINTAVTE
jgi:hypothetical protein